MAIHWNWTAQENSQLEKAIEQWIFREMYWSRLQKGETIVDELQGKTYTAGDGAWAAQRKGIKLTYCTDTRPDSVYRG